MNTLERYDPHRDRRFSVIHECTKNNNPHSKLPEYYRCELLHCFGPVLLHHASTKQSVNQNLLESLRCTYRCCTIGGSLFSVQYFAIALYLWRCLSENFPSTFAKALL